MGNLTIKPASGGLLKLQDAGSTDRIQITDGGSTVLYEDDGNAALTIDTSGDSTFAGIIKLSANKGIDFSAAQTSATEAGTGTTTAETLDSYEEGTFTPGITGTTGAPSGVNYSYGLGKYTKIGRIVHFQLNMSASSTTSEGTGNILITGIPFPISTSDSWTSGSRYYQIGVPNVEFMQTSRIGAGLMALGLAGESYIRLWRNNGGTGGMTGLTWASDIDGDFNFRITGSYPTDS